MEKGSEGQGRRREKGVRVWGRGRGREKGVRIRGGEGEQA